MLSQLLKIKRKRFCLELMSPQRNMLSITTATCKMYPGLRNVCKILRTWFKSLQTVVGLVYDNPDQATTRNHRIASSHTVLGIQPYQDLNSMIFLCHHAVLNSIIYINHATFTFQTFRPVKPKTLPEL